MNSVAWCRSRKCSNSRAGGRSNRRVPIWDCSVLHRVAKLLGSRVFAVDGEVGKVRDAYFEDVSWVMRYLVVETGGWLLGRRVLISPQSVESLDFQSHSVSLSLPRARIEACPDVDTDKPVSRQYESEFNRYYGYPSYWAQLGQWGAGPVLPVTMASASDALELAERRLARNPHPDTHLRSAKEVATYSINARDGGIGHVEDFLMEDATWAIQYLVVAKGVWLFEYRVLISRGCIEEVDWANQCVAVDQTRHQIELAPRFQEQ